MMQASSLSAVVCTFRRQSYLRDLLPQLALQEEAPDEIIVVDNECSSSTAALVDTIAREHPGAGLRYLAEPLPGVSHARNRGMAAAVGSWIAFVDDDVLPVHGWSRALRFGMGRDPRVGVLAGPVNLLLDAAEPPWLRNEASAFLSWLGLFDCGPTDLAFDDDARAPALGRGNIAFSRRALAGELFDPRLGRNDVALFSCEQVPVLARIRARGFSTWYLAGARALARVPRERLVPRWFVERGFWHGRSSARLAHVLDEPDEGETPDRELGRVVSGLALAGVSFSRLPLRKRIEVAQLMGSVVELQMLKERNSIQSVIAEHLHMLDGDAPDEFRAWASGGDDAGRAVSVGAA